MNGRWSIRFLLAISLASIFLGFATFNDEQAGNGMDASLDESDQQLPESAAENEEDSSALKESQPENIENEANNDTSIGLIGFGTGIFTLLILSSAFSEVIKIAVLMAIVTPMIAKKSNRDELNRGRILGYIEANAGIHFSALRDALKLANGVTAHHLNVVETQGKIISWRDGKLRRYAAAHISPDQLHALSHPIVGTRLAILETLAEAGVLGMSNKEIGTKLELSRQLLSHHMIQLSSNQLIEKTDTKKRSPWRLTLTGSETLKDSHNTSS